MNGEGEVTRSTEATSAVAAAYAERRRVAMPNGIWGILLLAATESALFGTLIASYFYLRLRSPTWPPPGIERPDMTAPLILLGALAATGAPMLLAVRSARGGRVPRTWLLLLLAVVVQCGYLGVQAHLFGSDLSKFQPGDTAYGSVYFTMLTLDHVHVFVGIIAIFWLLARLLSGLTNYRLIAVRVIAIYWYFVIALTGLVVLTQISPLL